MNPYGIQVGVHKRQKPQMKTWLEHQHSKEKECETFNSNSEKKHDEPKSNSWLEHWSNKEKEWETSNPNSTWGNYWKAKELEKQRFFGHL